MILYTMLIILGAIGLYMLTMFVVHINCKPYDEWCYNLKYDFNDVFRQKISTRVFDKVIRHYFKMRQAIWGY